MKFYKFLKLLKFICSNWNYLPKDLQCDLVEQLDDYREMIIISKYERRNNEI